MRVLIVDDDGPFLESLSEGLGRPRWGFQILTAPNGSSALEVLDSETVDVVVTDLKMPVMDGFEFLFRLREKHGRVPAMAMSADVNAESERRLYGLGIPYWLEKPFDLSDLANAILRLGEPSPLKGPAAQNDLAVQNDLPISAFPPVSAPSSIPK